MEKASVVQKEWSVISQEFTSIVTDSLENYSAAGVTDDTELTQATTSQNQHSNVSNITALVQGSNGFVTSSASAAFGDEIMKGVLRWILGPSFDFMPPEVVSLFTLSDTVGADNIQGLTLQQIQALISGDLCYGVSFTGNTLNIFGPPTTGLVDYVLISGDGEIYQRSY
jgi:hypothetical protein